jgi:hypothetical protein
MLIEVECRGNNLLSDTEQGQDFSRDDYVCKSLVLDV